MPNMRSKRISLLLPSVLLAAVIGTLVPTPNVAGGGAGKMFLILFLAVIIKATGDYALSQWSKRKNDTQIDKSKG